MKLCRLCSKSKSLDKFSINRRYADGLQPECRQCYADIQKASRLIRDQAAAERERLRLSTPPGYKNCTGCKELKPVIEFERHVTGRNGLRARCKACARAQRNAYHKLYYSNNKVAFLADGRQRFISSPRTVLRHAVQNALKRRPTDNPITVEWIMDLWYRQEGRCALSGIKMTWASGQGMPQPTSISIDRIERLKGYEPNNVRLVCHFANQFKGIMGDSEMDDMLKVFFSHRFGSTWPVYPMCAVA